MTPPDPSRLRSLEPPDSLRLRVLQAARGRPVPERSDRLLPGLYRAGLAAAAMLAGLELWGGASAAAGRPAAQGAWIVGGTVALALAATWLSLPSRRSMLFPA